MPSVQIVAGALLGTRYRLEKKLGKGGVGEVWAAVDQQTSRPVAVKLLRALHRSDDKLLERFAREGRVLERIDSPFVCKVLDVGSGDAETIPFLLLERLVGRPLDDALKRGKTLPIAEVRAIVDDVLSGMIAAHGVGVLHRDIKPSNVVLVDAPVRRIAKLVDFGVSKLLPGDPGLTTTGATLGSPHYMAPEQVGGAADVDERCDLYAAATLAFRALAG